MTVKTAQDNTTYRLSEAHVGGSRVTVVLDLGNAIQFNLANIFWTVNEINYDTWYNVEYSLSGDNWVAFGHRWADRQYHVKHTQDVSAAGTSQFIHIRFSCNYQASGNVGELDIYDIGVYVTDLVPDLIHIDAREKHLSLIMSPTFSGYVFDDFRENIQLIFPHIITQVDGGDGGGDGNGSDPTSKNLINGSVKKLGLPFVANVVAVSLGNEPKVLARTISDSVTGDYELDVYPHTDEVLIYVAPDYGRDFAQELLMTTGQIIHPTIPNKYVYVAQNDGKLGNAEPNWPEQGQIVSGEVTLKVVPLHRPLMNGFVKPTVVPI